MQSAQSHLVVRRAIMRPIATWLAVRYGSARLSRSTYLDAFIADNYWMTRVESIDGQGQFARFQSSQHGRLEAVHGPVGNPNPITRNKD